MDIQAIFGLQFVLSLLAWGVIAGFLLSPRLAQLPQYKALLWLSLPHAFRHVGMVFLVPGVVDQPLPREFADPAAYDDLATGVFALFAIIALRARWSVALALVWLFNIVGTVDLANAPSAPRCRAEVRRGLVHPDHARTPAPGDALPDLQTAARTRQ